LKATICGPIRRALDQAGDVRQHEGRAALAVRRDDAEVRFERRERIVADLRRRPRDRGQEGGLARVREADETGIGNQPQFECDPARIARRAEFGHPRRLMRAGHVVRVTEATPPAACDDRDFVRLGEVHDQVARLGIPDRRTRRDGNPLVRTARPFAPLGRALDAGPRLEVRGELEGKQAVEVRVNGEDDVTAAPTVATVRAAARLEFLPPEGRRAVATLARFHIDLCPVYQHCPVTP